MCTQVHHRPQKWAGVIENTTKILKQTIINQEILKSKKPNKDKRFFDHKDTTLIHRKEFAETFPIMINIILFCSRIMGFEWKFVSDDKELSENELDTDIVFVCDVISSSSEMDERKIELHFLLENQEFLKFINCLKCTNNVFIMCTALYFLVHIVYDFEELYSKLLMIFKGTQMSKTLKQRHNILKEELLKESVNQKNFRTILQNVYFCLCYLKNLM